MRIQPLAVISAGLSSSVKGIRIESKFVNLMDGKYPDADGYAPHKIPIIHEAIAPDTVQVKSQHKKLFNILVKNNIPAEHSDNADTFICNALGYKTSLGTSKDRYNKRNLFIHVPWTTEYRDKVSVEPEKVFLQSDLYYKGLELLIRNI